MKDKLFWIGVIVIFALFSLAMIFPTAEAFTWGDNSILAYYRLNELVGTTITDANGLRNAQTNSSTIGITGIINYAEALNQTYGENINWTPYNLTGNFTLNWWGKNRNATASIFSYKEETVSNQNRIFYNGGTAGIEINTYNGTTVDIYFTIPTNKDWEMYTLKRFDDNISYYVNGSYINSSTLSSLAPIKISSFGAKQQIVTSRGYYNGSVDEIGIWNRSLSDSELVELFNSGSGLTYPIPTINVSLISPANATVTSNANQTFICNASATNNVSNITFYIWNSTSLINSSLMSNNTWSYTAIAGINNCTASIDSCANTYDADWSTLGTFTSGDNQVVFSDYVKPSNTLNAIWQIKYKCGNGTITTQNISIPSSCSSGTNVSTWFKSSNYFGEYVLGIYCYNTSSGGTINLMGSGNNLCDSSSTLTAIYDRAMWWNISSSNFTYNYNIPSINNYTWNCLASDNLGNSNWSASNYTIQYEPKSYSVAYDTPVYGSTTNRIYFNLTSTESISTINATLRYNNTNYSMDILSGNLSQYIFYKDVNSPIVFANSNVVFNITFYFNGAYYNTISYTQAILAVPEINVSIEPCTDASLFFNLTDEQNYSNINGSFVYNFKYGVTNTTQIQKYGTIANANHFYVCINASAVPYYILGDSEVDYQASGYVLRRWYGFNTTNLTSSQINITLLDLINGNATAFQLTVMTPSLQVFSNYYVHLLRSYPGQNSQNVTDIGKTDAQGNTVIYVVTQDVDYQLALYHRNGTLVKMSDYLRMVCATSPCTYTWYVQPQTFDYTEIDNIQQSLDYNYTSYIWTFIYSDPSLKTTSMNLTVWKDTGTSSYVICTNTLLGSAGTITCNTSAYTSGTLRAEVYRSASPEVPLAQLIISIVGTTLQSTSGLFISILLAIPIMFILIMISPFAAVVGGILALVPALILGSINVVIFGGIILLGAIVAHMIKRVS